MKTKQIERTNQSKLAGNCIQGKAQQYETVCCAQCIFSKKMSLWKYMQHFKLKVFLAVSKFEGLILYTADGVINKTLPIAKLKFEKKSECDFANND